MQFRKSSSVASSIRTESSRYKTRLGTPQHGALSCNTTITCLPAACSEGRAIPSPFKSKAAPVLYARSTSCPALLGERQQDSLVRQERGTPPASRQVGRKVSTVMGSDDGLRGRGSISSPTHGHDEATSMLDNALSFSSSPIEGCEEPMPSDWLSPTLAVYRWVEEKLGGKAALQAEYPWPVHLGLRPMPSDSTPAWQNKPEWNVEYKDITDSELAQRCWSSVRCTRVKTAIVFHGTSWAGALGIASDGFNPALRKGDSADGEYFTAQVSTALHYARGGKYAREVPKHLTVIVVEVPRCHLRRVSGGSSYFQALVCTEHTVEVPRAILTFSPVLDS